MIVIINDVKGNKVELEISSTKITVKQLKDEYQNKTGINSNNVDFMYNGNKLIDENSLETYNIDDKSTLISLKKHNEDINKNQSNKAELANEKKEKSINSNIINGNNKGNNQESDLNNQNDNKDKEEDSENKIILPKELKKIGILMKILTYKEPDRMNIILNNIKTTNKSLLERIKAKKDMFYEFLQKPITKDELDIFRQNYQDAKNLLDINDNKKREGKIEIFLTQEETDDIKKIRSIGFDLEDTIEAYVKCDLNGEKAITYLLDLKNKKDKDNKDYDINGND